MHDDRISITLVMGSCASGSGDRRTRRVQPVWLEQGRNSCLLEIFAGDVDQLQKLSPLNAALLNSTFIQGFELDDVHTNAPWHANAVILPALFAAIDHLNNRPTQKAKIDGSTLLLSTIIGFEVGSRVGRALHGSNMLARGFHSVSAAAFPASYSLRKQRQEGISIRRRKEFILLSED